MLQGTFYAHQAENQTNYQSQTDKVAEKAVKSKKEMNKDW